MTCTLKVHGSSPQPGTHILPSLIFSCSFSMPPGKCRGTAITTQSLPVKPFVAILYLYLVSKTCTPRKEYRLKKSNKMQLYADIYLLLNYSTCFGSPSRPSSVHKTVVAAYGTDHRPTIWGTSFLKRVTFMFMQASSNVTK